jgi:hypothetical protein
MGYRTVVLLENDRASEWEKDPELGRKIAVAMNYAMPARMEPGDRSKADLGYGHVVSCHHADTQVIGVFDSYSFKPMAFSHWYAKEDDEAMKLKMLKAAAEEMGYRLVKRSK